MKFTLKKKNIMTQKGFTLIETLVAISILLVSIVGPMEIASKGLFSAYYARDEITAYYLAQEALEYIRNSRDTTYLRDIYTGGIHDWLFGLETCKNDEGCKVDTREPFYLYNGLNTEAVSACDVDTGCGRLKFNSTTGLYSYFADDPDSKYTRQINIYTKENHGVSNQEAIVEVKVTWFTGSVFSNTKVFTLRERLFNWQRQN